MAFILGNNGQLIHTSDLAIFAKSQPMYKYEASIDAKEMCPLIDIDVLFVVGNDFLPCMKSPLRAIIDTGTSITTLAVRVAPTAIKNIFLGSKNKVDSLGGPIDVCTITNIQLRFPDKNAKEGFHAIPLDCIHVIDDEKNRQSKLKQGREPFDLYIGGDLLKKGEFLYNIPTGKFTLKL